MAARAILPEFGGAASVWTASLLYFQGALLTGYLVAYGVDRYGRRALRIFLTVLFVSAVGGLWANWSNRHMQIDTPWPVLGVMIELSAMIGAPYVCLATSASIVPPATYTSPQLTYRLFGWSNAGSILGLMLYPLLIEPIFGVNMQRRIWMCVFVAWAIGLGLFLYTTPAPAQMQKAKGRAIPWQNMVAWTLYAALGVALLMSISAAIVADLTVSPILWVIPLSVYLFTYVLCFSQPQRLKPRRWVIPILSACIGSVGMLHYGWRLAWWIQLSGWSAILFLGCMVCHGALVRQRPDVQHLPAYYLAIAIGGFVGGLACAIGAPNLFSFRAEIHFILPALLWLRWRVYSKDQLTDQPFRELTISRGLFAMTAVFLVVGLGWHAHKRGRGETVLMRNFYGALQIKTYEQPRRYGGMVHLLDGRISHGYQLRGTEQKKRPTTYFVPDSGIGRVFEPTAAARRVAILGLGVGTLATYAKRDDHFVFFELNPHVIDVAQRYFSYLSDAEGTVETFEGDGRILMGRWSGPPLDVIVVDAFTGDAIPAHLITRTSIRAVSKTIEGQWHTCN